MKTKSATPPDDGMLMEGLRSSRVYRGRTARCHRCGSRDLYCESPDLYCCAKCHKQTHPIKETCLASARIPIRKSLLLVWHFSQGSPALNASKALGISYPTVLRFYSRIREATHRSSWFWINPHSLKNKLSDEVIVIKEACKQDGTSTCTWPQEPQLSIAIGAKTDPMVRLALAKAGKKSECEVTVFRREYLIQCLSGLADEDRLPVERNGRFWKLARRHMRKFRGITARKLPGYLGEFAFRMNHDRHDVFKALLDALLEYRPNRSDGSGPSRTALTKHGKTRR